MQCAVIGMSNRISNHEVIGMPPSWAAARSTNALACGMLVGIRLPSLHSRRVNGQNQRRRSRMRSEASIVCITRKIRVWRAKPNGQADRKSTRLNSSHTVIYTLSLHDALPICERPEPAPAQPHAQRGVDRLHHQEDQGLAREAERPGRSEEHTSELQSHSDLHSFPTRRSSDL